jgi:catechol 2,3-dioxygenase-like lactoylglutathione lyase family enzyme
VTDGQDSGSPDVTEVHAPAEPGNGTVRRDFLKRAAVAGIGATGAGALLAGQAGATTKPSPPRGGKRSGGLPGERSLGGNISKALFLTINVSDLDRAVDFYEATLPVKRAEEVNPPAQAFNGYGISKGQFRARMMRDSQPFQGGGILLVQWLSPGPVGKPYAEANHVGWYREHFNASQTGMNARYQQALAAGGRPYGPPSRIAITPTLIISSFAFRDPDGTTLEWVGPLDPTPGGPPDTVTGPNTNCRNIHESFKFYRDVLGFDMQIRLNPTEPQPATNGSLGDAIRNPDGSLYTGLVDFDAAIMVPRGDSRNSVDLLEWQIPGSFGEAYEDANNLGIMNLTYEVNNVQVVYEKLLRLLPKPRNFILAPPETWDLGDFGVRKTLHIVDPDGTRYGFFEKVQSTDPTP